jgi:hypothetical protein
MDKDDFCLKLAQEFLNEMQNAIIDNEFGPEVDTLDWSDAESRLRILNKLVPEAADRVVELHEIENFDPTKPTPFEGALSEL